MDVSKEENLDGTRLIEQIVILTGLPMTCVQKEISSILNQNGLNPHQLTLDEFRSAMLAYLETFQPDSIPLSKKN